MDSGWIAAPASVLSALIIAVSVLVAFLQLRHFRNANDIVVYLRLVDYRDSPEMQAVRRQVSAIAAKLGRDPEYLERLADSAFPHTGRAFEHLAMLSHRYIDSGRMARDYDGLLHDPRPA